MKLRPFLLLSGFTLLWGTLLFSSHWLRTHPEKRVHHSDATRSHSLQKDEKKGQVAVESGNTRSNRSLASLPALQIESLSQERGGPARVREKKPVNYSSNALVIEPIRR